MNKDIYKDRIKRKKLQGTTTLVDMIINRNEKIIDKNVPKVINEMKKHIDELSSVLSTPGPENRPRFTRVHEENFIQSTGIRLNIITNAIKKCKMIDDNHLTRNNEFYILISLLISYHYRNNTEYKKVSVGRLLNLYLALRIYKTSFSLFFPYYVPNPEVMAATIERLNSNRFNIKKHKTVFNTIVYIADSHYENFQDIMQDPIDDNTLYYIQNLYNRIKLMMKTIANLYMENHKKGVREGISNLQSENDEGETYLNEVENISTLVSINSKKIYLSFVSDSVANPKILHAVCKKTKVSFSKMTITINKMIESRDPLLEMLIVKMLSHYYVSGGSVIKSTRFINAMVEAYSVSNTSDETIIAIKDLLDALMKKYSKTYLETNNVGSISCLKKTLLLYITLYSIDVL